MSSGKQENQASQYLPGIFREVFIRKIYKLGEIIAVLFALFVVSLGTHLQSGNDRWVFLMVISLTGEAVFLFLLFRVLRIRRYWYQLSDSGICIYCGRKKLRYISYQELSKIIKFRRKKKYILMKVEKYKLVFPLNMRNKQDYKLAKSGWDKLHQKTNAAFPPYHADMERDLLGNFNGADLPEHIHGGAHVGTHNGLW